VATFYRLCHRVLIHKGCKVELSVPLEQISIEAAESAATEATEAKEAAEARTTAARSPAGRKAAAVRKAQKNLTAKEKRQSKRKDTVGEAVELPGTGL
jgi:hypothetical protein